MARDRRSGGRPDGERPAGRPAGKDAKPGKDAPPVKPVKPVKAAKAGAAGRAGAAGTSRSEPAQAPDLRVQLPYFAARLGVFALVLVALLLLTNLVVVWAVLIALVFAGVSTYPLARMQKAAAARSANRPAPGLPPDEPAGR